MLCLACLHWGSKGKNEFSKHRKEKFTFGVEDPKCFWWDKDIKCGVELRPTLNCRSKINSKVFKKLAEGGTQVLCHIVTLDEELGRHTCSWKYRHWCMNLEKKIFLSGNYTKKKQDNIIFGCFSLIWRREAFTNFLWHIFIVHNDGLHKVIFMGWTMARPLLLLSLLLVPLPSPQTVVLLLMAYVHT